MSWVSRRASLRGRALQTSGLLLVVASVAAGWAWSAPGPPQADAVVLVDEMTRHAVPRPGEGGAAAGAMTYSRAFAGYALINEGLDHPEQASVLAAKLDLLIDQLLQPSVSAGFGQEHIDVAGHRLSPSVAFRGHLALLLAGRALLGGAPPSQGPLRTALLHGLARDVIAAPNHLLPSHGWKTYPADNEVLAAALAIAPERGDVSVHEAAVALQRSLDSLEVNGLPPSEVTPGTLIGKDVPRGCALSWSVAMRGLYAPARARSLYTMYRDRYYVTLGPVVGFREWPRGVDRPGDWDSGPIVLGIGTAASGIGLGAARLAGEQADFARLQTSARLAGGGRLVRGRGSHWLERAMWFWATTARVWRAAAAG